MRYKTRRRNPTPSRRAPDDSTSLIDRVQKYIQEIVDVTSEIWGAKKVRITVDKKFMGGWKIEFLLNSDNEWFDRTVTVGPMWSGASEFVIHDVTKPRHVVEFTEIGRGVITAGLDPRSAASAIDGKTFGDTY